VPLAFLLIPDEFQVEDRLWKDAVAGMDGKEMMRLKPQRRIKVWLDARGLPYLDLLPVLRDVPALEDGDRHLYHRRDTHLNARGNEAVGKALAPFIEELLGQSSPSKR
jgi:hypothetical protein